jgi:DNA-binding transcriptional ArsR family regulator
VSYPHGKAGRLSLVNDVGRRRYLEPAGARQVKEALLPLDMPDALRSELVRSVDAITRSETKWAFIMLGTEENLAVVDYLSLKARRPVLALRLWADMLNSFRWETGEIVDSRAVLAGRHGVEPAAVSHVMSLLSHAGVIRRERDGRGVRYFLNSNVGTRLGGALRDEAQVAERAPLLALMEGGLK